MLLTEQWSLLGQCNWEVSGVPVHRLSSLSKFSSHFCCFLQEKLSRERNFRQVFFVFLKNLTFAGFSLGENPRIGCDGGGEGSLQMKPEGPSSGWVWFYGHVLTVQNSHEECLLKSWRLNHRKYLKYLRLWIFSLTASGEAKMIYITFTLQKWLFNTVFRFIKNILVIPVGQLCSHNGLQRC